MLHRYVTDGRLTAMPRPGLRRQLVLEYVAQVFEPGRRYDERTVNALLHSFWPDVPALRRYLVDAQMLERAEGFYWRIGGYVDTD